MSNTRTERILRMLSIPKFESNKGTSKGEQLKAINGSQELFRETPAEDNVTNKENHITFNIASPRINNSFGECNTPPMVTSSSDISGEPILPVKKKRRNGKNQNLKQNSIHVNREKTNDANKGLFCKTSDNEYMENEIEANISGSTIDNNSSDEYIPPSSSDTSNESLLPVQKRRNENTSKKKQVSVAVNSTYYHNKKVTIATADSTASPAAISPIQQGEDANILSNNVDAETITVSAAQTKDKKRVRDKRHACYFCGKTVIHIARHLETLHKNEIEVAKILALPKLSSTRKTKFEELTRAGDFYHNCNVLSVKQGELILVRRPSINEIKFVTYSSYGPCPYCLGYMLKKHLWHHVTSACKKSLESNNEEGPGQRHVISESNAIMTCILGWEFPSEYSKQVTEHLRDDDVGLYCREDSLILRFGFMLFEKYGVTQVELIRQNMRQLSRLTLELQKQSIAKYGLSDYLIPERFDLIISCTKQVCGNSVSRGTSRPQYQIPSLALKLGHNLRKCVNIQRGTALRKGDLKQNDSLLSFLTLMELEWSSRISSNALATLATRKLNMTQLLPVTSDIKYLSSYIENEVKHASKNLKEKCCSNYWNRLAMLTLSRLILFNKRRSGEAAKMTIQQYTSRPDWNESSTEELKKSLSSYEQKLAERLNVVKIVGKRGRKVPLLLTPIVKTCIDLLISTRYKCEISQENEYVFARGNNTLSHMRGHDCLRKVVDEVRPQLQQPDYITGTKLRKYIATVCQVFSLTENEVDWLARHLGHDIAVHREFYRLHEDAVELTKVSRLLLAVDQGEANQFAGKSLKDIHVEELPALNEDEEDEIDEKDGDENDEDKEEAEVLATNVSEDLEREESRTEASKESSHLKSKKRNSRSTAEHTTCSNKKDVVKAKWTTAEKNAVLKFFRVNIRNGVVPGKHACEDCIKQNSVLEARKWTHIKFCVKNEISKIRKLKK